MTKIRPAYAYIAVGIALIMGWFYWTEVRPHAIAKDCAINILEFRTKNRDPNVVDSMLVLCRHAGGYSEFEDALKRRDQALPAGASDMGCAADAETGEC